MQINEVDLSDKNQTFVVDEIRKIKLGEKVKFIISRQPIEAELATGSSQGGTSPVEPIASTTHLTPDSSSPAPAPSTTQNANVHVYATVLQSSSNMQQPAALPANVSNQLPAMPHLEPGEDAPPNMPAPSTRPGVPQRLKAVDMRVEIPLGSAGSVGASGGVGLSVIGRRVPVSSEEGKEPLRVDSGIYIKAITETGAAYRVCSLWSTYGSMYCESFEVNLSFKSYYISLISWDWRISVLIRAKINCKRMH